MIDEYVRYDYWRALVARVDPPSLADWIAALRPEWMSSAACRGDGPAEFVPARGQSIARARALCSECSVRAECLAYALADSDIVGVWGGTTTQERSALRRQAAENAKRPATLAGRSQVPQTA
jgi:WhiB family redox-sensing transcriptional regulator